MLQWGQRLIPLETESSRGFSAYRTTASMGPAVDTAGNPVPTMSSASPLASASMGPAVDTAGNKGIKAEGSIEPNELQWGQRLIPLETNNSRCCFFLCHVGFNGASG